MYFDGNKGVRKREYQPNPRKVDMSKSSSLEDVLNRANEIYFNLPDISCLSLADSNGIKIEISNVIDWKLEQYYASNHYQPSRHKVYAGLFNSFINVMHSC